MPRPKVIFESSEVIEARCPRSKEWICYDTVLRVRDSGKKPVSLDLTLDSIQPFAFDMPLNHQVRAESVTRAYVKVMRFLWRYGFELK